MLYPIVLQWLYCNATLIVQSYLDSHPDHVSGTHMYKTLFQEIPNSVHPSLRLTLKRYFKVFLLNEIPYCYCSASSLYYSWSSGMVYSVLAQTKKMFEVMMSLPSDISMIYNVVTGSSPKWLALLGIIDSRLQFRSLGSTKVYFKKDRSSEGLIKLSLNSKHNIFDVSSDNSLLININIHIKQK